MVVPYESFQALTKLHSCFAVMEIAAQDFVWMDRNAKKGIKDSQEAADNEVEPFHLGEIALNLLFV